MEWLEDNHMTQAELARKWKVTQPYIHGLCHGYKPITPRTAIRLQQTTGIKAIVWLNMESAYRLDMYRASIRRF